MPQDAPLRIGLSARIMHRPPPELGFRGKVLQYLEQSVAHWIMARGAIAFMIPTIVRGGDVQRASISVRDYVAALDGLVLQGGADVSPEMYGQAPQSADWHGDAVRDRYEIELLWEFVFQGKPILGICRGAQLINVAFGGSLFQDIPSQVRGAGRHFDADAYDELSHEILIEPDSMLAHLYPGSPRPNVISIHHQAIDKLGNGLVVEARSVPDGIVEVIRWTGSSYVVGVQWHPEFHKNTRRGLLDDAPLLVEFLHRALERRRTLPPSETSTRKSATGVIA